MRLKVKRVTRRAKIYVAKALRVRNIFVLKKKVERPTDVCFKPPADLTEEEQKAALDFWLSVDERHKKLHPKKGKKRF